ncbi:uncharacterized protein UMAG_03253 [Mycosarcoma maydis]|uniref:C2 NT-type domain-containing protein n=1 Tax=Mycosarcoma maydis TaxID=5270 RepID=A0A0D1DYG1_MYCMD|nr:uncharacterized protein UMAG_03253 [Ustilago maydis 521]KIS68681.1 hypothetical protein UMAG_03253 [Ustilago maydis 521]|eukprot:XP_011389673.1 hypothetical protein UMAG_03253 [Ustilago maydis 521]
MSLLGSFSFGQKHSYFHVQLTIHELTNVPLVNGLFACKWKIKGSHSLASLQHAAAAAVHQQATRVVSNVARKAMTTSHQETVRTTHANDNESKEPQNLSLGLPLEHSNAQRQASGSTSADAASILSQSSRDTSQHSSHKPGLLSQLLHPLDPPQTHPKRSEHTDDDNSDALVATPALHAQKCDSHASLSPSDALEAGSIHSRSRADSITSRKTCNSRTKSIKDFVQSKTVETQDHNVDPLLFFSQEPKGETDFVKVQDHLVEWQREVQVGMRIAIGKPRTSPSSSHHDSPSVSAKSSAKDLRSRAHREQHLDDLSTAWGRLTNSELKLTIRQEMPANVKSTTHPNVFGNVVIDLSEFAPDPPATSSSARHRHHHHHHHHHHHPHHHRSLHATSGDHSYRDRACRSETRKFLLNGSKTNATVKITITMTFLGGAREYYVPPISNGLMVNGLGSIMAPTLLEHSHDSASLQVTSCRASSKSSNSESSSLRNEPVRTSASNRNRENIGSGLPSASSLSLHNFNSDQSQHNLYGPPLRSIYAKKTWTNRIPQENLVPATPGSEEAKRKARRTNEISYLTGRTQGDRAPDDIVNAIFKGIPVGGSHHGQLHDDAAAAAAKAASKAAAARASRAERATVIVDSQAQQPSSKPSKSPERTRERIRTISSASSLSKKSERSFSFGLGRNKEKEKEKEKGKDKDKDKDKDKKKEKEKESKEKVKDKDKVPTNNIQIKPVKSQSTTDAKSGSRDKTQSPLLSVPSSGGSRVAPDVLVESPSASAEALPRINSDSAIAVVSAVTRTSTKRLSSVRWALGGSVDAASDASSAQETSLGDTEARDRAAMPPPPSVVVKHAYIPIRAGGITAATLSDVDLAGEADNGSGPTQLKDKEKRAGDANLSPLAVPVSSPAAPSKAEPIKGADAASLRPETESSSTSTVGDAKKPSSNDLKGLYQARLSIPQSLSNSTTVGLERLKRTSRAIGQFAKDAARSSRSSSRPSSSSSATSLHDSQGVSSRERKSKGNRGIEPSEAASKGWQGAGWLRPISTTPAPLPPCSPDSTSSDEDESEHENYADADTNALGKLETRTSLDGRQSSATDQTALSDTLDTPKMSPSETFRSEHNREGSFASIYHDVEDGDPWTESDEPVKLLSPAITTSAFPVHNTSH